MSRIYFYLVTGICVILGGCARPVALFDVESEHSAASEVRFNNLSKDADNYKWYVNEELRSNDKQFTFWFPESGRYIVQLDASKGSQVDRYTQEIIIDAPELCHYLIKTSYGDMVIALNEETPGHLANFSELVEKGFYKGVNFHRIIQGFMIQAGETRDPRYIKRKELDDEINTSLIHHRGAVAAARMPDEMNPEKKSSGTQFYIVHGRKLTRELLMNYASEKLLDYTEDQIEKYLEVGGTPQLDGEYTVFGYLVSGFDTLDRIASVSTDVQDRPIEDVEIIDIIEIN